MSELTTRLIYIYSAQSILALIICLLFFHFSKKYSRPFLRWWAISWVFYSVQFLSSTAITLSPPNPSSPWSMLIIIASYAQVMYLLFGIYTLMNKRVSVPYHIAGGLAVLFVSLVSFILFHDNPEASNMRYLIRVGIKSWLVGGGFLFIAILILKNDVFSRSFSKLFLGLAFILYAGQQIWFGFIVYLNTSGMPVSFPISSFGIIDLFVLCVVAVGMIMWLLENEHQELLIANKQLDSFLYRTSHDLRAPISSVLGLTNLGKLESTDANAIKYLNLIETSIGKLDVIFRDILNYSKSAKLPVHNKKIRFSEFVGTLYEKVQYASSVEDLAFKVEADNSDEVITDPVQLEIIMGNIISNAIKYQDPRKDEHNISVELENGSSRQIITISDNGIGIENENFEKIFEMFYRGTTTGEGSGLGLFIAREAAKKINAKLDVTSEPGAGTRFTIHIPAPSA